MVRITSVMPGSYFDKFIQSVIAAGRNKNAREIIEDGLRLPEGDEKNKMTYLKEGSISTES